MLAFNTTIVAERMYSYDLIYTPLIREPLAEADIDDFLAAIQKVIANSVDLSVVHKNMER